MRHERYRAVDSCLLQPPARRILAARTPESEIQTAPFDHERMRKAIRLAVRLGADSAFKDLIIARITPTDADLASDGTLDDWLMRNLGTAHHVSGTCKMGPASDPMVVISQYGRGHGLEGLWVADASIMPDCIRANTNATTIMIGERVADFIKEER
jgi:choline dehydrogenase